MRREFGYLPILLASLAACGRCGSRPPPAPSVSVEDLLPRSPQAVVVIPSISGFMGAASGLASAVARFPEGETAGGMLEALGTQLGFDPRDPKALAKSGIDGSRPAAAVFEGAEPWAVVPVSDRARFRETAARLAASRLGADVVARQGETTVFSSKAGPAAALAFANGYGLVAAGPSAAEELARALGRAKGQRLSDEPLFTHAIQKLELGWNVAWYVPGGSPALPRQPPPGQAFAGSFSYRDGRLAARLVSMLSVAEGTALSGFAKPAGQKLIGLLPPGDPLVARAGGDPASLGFAWQALVPEPIRTAIAEAKIDVEREVLGNLAPGVALAVGLAPHLDLSSAPSLDPRRQNPFRYLTLDAFAKVRDREKALATLGKLRGLPSGLGVTTRRQRLSGAEVTTFQYALGDGPSVALVGDTLAVTGGEGEMESALARLSGKANGYSPPPWMRPMLLGQISDGAVVDPAALRQSIEAIPPSAYGGLTGLTVRSLVRRFASPLIWLGPLTAMVDVKADAVIADASLIFR